MHICSLLWRYEWNAYAFLPFLEPFIKCGIELYGIFSGLAYALWQTFLWTLFDLLLNLSFACCGYGIDCSAEAVYFCWTQATTTKSIISIEVDCDIESKSLLRNTNTQLNTNIIRPLLWRTWISLCNPIRLCKNNVRMNCQQMNDVKSHSWSCHACSSQPTYD